MAASVRPAAKDLQSLADQNDEHGFRRRQIFAHGQSGDHRDAKRDVRRDPSFEQSRKRVIEGLVTRHQRDEDGGVDAEEVFENPQPVQ